MDTPNTNTPADIYFVNEPEQTRLAERILERWKNYQDYLLTSGRLAQMQDSYNRLFGFDPDGKAWTTRRIGRAGKEKQLLKIRVNHFGSILRALVSITTAQLPKLAPKAKNTDSGSTSSASIAEGLLEEGTKVKRLPRRWKTQVRHAVAYRAGYLAVTWDPDAGAELQAPGPEDVKRSEADPEQILTVEREGDIRLRNFTPVDVAYDFRTPDWDRVEWLITRDWGNRFTLAALAKRNAATPEEGEELANRILSIRPESDAVGKCLSGAWRTDWGTVGSNDLIPIYELWHLPSEAVPEGKHVVVLSREIVPVNEPMKYRDASGRAFIPVDRLVPDDLDDTAEGHTSMFDLLALQEAVDATASAGLTKSQRSMPAILWPKQAQVAKKELDTPWANVEYSGDREPTMFTPSVSPEQDWAGVGVLQKQMETLSGMNAVARGNPEQAGTAGSGKALAFVQAQAILANSSLQANTYESMERTGSWYVRCYQLFAQAPRTLQRVTGRAKSYMTKTFTADDLKDIDGIETETVSPLQQTTEGRRALLASLNEMGVQLEAGQIVTFLKTGEYNNPLEEAMNEDQFIRQENEALQQGLQIPDASLGEDHIKHIFSQRPKTLEAKMNPAEHDARLQHIGSHAALLNWAMLPPPVIQQLATLGFGPPAPPPPPGGAPPPGAGGPPPGPPGPGAGAPPPNSNPTNMPQLPDGEPVDPRIEQAAAQGQPPSL